MCLSNVLNVKVKYFSMIVTFLKSSRSFVSSSCALLLVKQQQQQPCRLGVHINPSLAGVGITITKHPVTRVYVQTIVFSQYQPVVLFTAHSVNRMSKPSPLG